MTMQAEIAEFARECASDPLTGHYGGADGGFSSCEEWAGWWLEGDAGDAARRLSREYGVEYRDVYEAMRAALIEACDLDAINALCRDA